MIMYPIVAWGIVVVVVVVVRMSSITSPALIYSHETSTSD